MSIKSTFLILSAFIFSLLFSEIVVAKVIGYPAYGVSYKVRYRKGAETWTNIRKPHAQIYNVEGRIKTNFNNLGIPGVDIEKIVNPVVVLGSSYIEALQYKPDKISTSLFQEKLNKEGRNVSVLNLGCSGHDPYDSWFRLKYFEKALNVVGQDVILVLNSDNKAWFNRHPKPFSFDLSDDFGQVNAKSATKAMIALRNASSLVEMYVNAFKKKEINEDIHPDEPSTNQLSDMGVHELSEEMKMCLLEFNETYSDFKVISVYDNEAFNSALSHFCKKFQIDCTLQPLAKPEYMINGAGHLNEIGNQILGELLYQVYMSS